MSDDLARRPTYSEGSSRALSTPLQPSVVYRAESPDALNATYDGTAPGYTYSREGHANAAVLARKIDSLEGATGGMMTGSGMAAVSSTLLALLSQGDHVIGGNQLYGRSLRLLSTELPRYGIAHTLVDATDASAVEAAIRPETRLLLMEVVSNPTLRVADMEAIVEIAKRHKLILVVDNTFTTPLAYKPLAAGADIVIHSVTKLLAGHSDAMLGYVACVDPAHREAIDGVIQTHGFTPSPYDCWMAERGLMSFGLRYDRAEANAAALADHLAKQPGLERVIYPGRPDHPDHNRAGALLGPRFGNMVSFEIAGSLAAANRLVKAMPNLPFAPTLGDIGTTLSHAASSSHRALSPEDRAKLGMSDGFFRISVGIEEIDTLKAEFTQGFSALKG